MSLDQPEAAQLTAHQEGTCRSRQSCALRAVALPKSMSTLADISVTEAGRPTHGRGRVKMITVPRLNPIIEEVGEGFTISKNVRPGLS